MVVRENAAVCRSVWSTSHRRSERPVVPMTALRTATRQDNIGMQLYPKITGACSTAHWS
jgi:hypothetical protein